MLTARPVAGTPTPSDESSEVRWFAPGAAAMLPMDRSMRLRIEHTLLRLAGHEKPHLG